MHALSKRFPHPRLRVIAYTELNAAHQRRNLCLLFISKTRMLKRITAKKNQKTVAVATTDAERLARLHFHIKSGDYFPTLATFLGFVEETLAEPTTARTPLNCMEKELVKSLRKDLMHLHEYYQIEPRHT